LVVSVGAGTITAAASGVGTGVGVGVTTTGAGVTSGGATTGVVLGAITAALLAPDGALEVVSKTSLLDFKGLLTVSLLIISGILLMDGVVVGVSVSELASAAQVKLSLKKIVKIMVTAVVTTDILLKIALIMTYLSTI
jgi:hypothetical protein